MATKKVLVIEDEGPLRNALSQKCSELGYEVLSAKDGEEGLSVALKEHPDLILLDVVMPVMDGISMLKKLREDEWGKKVKVIVLTNLTDAETTAEAVEADSSEYLIKTDWKLSDIVAKVESHLKG